MERFPEKSCINCEYCETYFHSGTLEDPPDYGWECSCLEDTGVYNSTIERLIEFNNTKSATWCKSYREKMFTTCPTCNKEVNKPLHEWEIWSSAWDCDPFAVCSEACQKVETEKAEEYHKQLVKWDEELKTL